MKSLSYERAYTALPGLQEARLISYTLTAKPTKEETCYGIRVTETQSGRQEKDESYLFTSHRAQAEYLLTYLYENAVPPEHCISVIADVCAAQQWEDEDGVCTHPAAHRR